MQSALSKILGLNTRPEIARAQVAALQARISILYAIIAVNVFALACTHYRDNPVWQIVVVPGAFTLLIAIRAVVWSRIHPVRMSNRQIAKVRRSTVVLGPALSFSILLWAMTLQRLADPSPINDAMTNTGQAFFFVGITFMSCIFLLMHHRLAAILIGLAVAIPLSTYLFWAHRLVETAIGVNVLLVAAAALCVAIGFSRHFDQSVIPDADLLRLSAQNARLAAVDALTLLPNRRQFFREQAAAGAEQQEFAVIVCDLDGFKQINDVYGHQAGDDLLSRVAARLLKAAPDGSCVARMGGDEFTCLLVGDQSRSAQAIAERIMACCREPIVFDTFSAQVGASAGVCLSSNAFRSDAVYEQADYALFKAKQAGRGRVETFSGEHDQSMRRESKIAHLLRSADLQAELIPVFQPIVDARSFDIQAFEALIRWTSPELGMVGPSEFIPIAERTDLILDISRIVLRAALQHAARWPEHVLLKVNLSIRDLMSSQQTKLFVDDLGRSPVAPCRVTFEITETILAESLEQIRSNVNILRAAGCKIAIDDFGVGYSSLNYVHTLAPEMIKIDRCFVSQVATNETTQRVVRTIVELARNVGARSLAEGVETAAQARILAELGCEELQGYFFSHPVCAETSIEMARLNTTAWQVPEATVA